MFSKDDVKKAQDINTFIEEELGDVFYDYIEDWHNIHHVYIDGDIINFELIDIDSGSTDSHSYPIEFLFDPDPVESFREHLEGIKRKRELKKMEKAEKERIANEEKEKKQLAALIEKHGIPV